MTTDATTGPAPGAGQSLDFEGLRIGFDETVLRPRPWTALQSRWAAELLAHGSGADTDTPFLELCSGAGHIGLLTAHLSGRPLVAVDLSPEACAWTRTNADAAGLGTRVEVRQVPLEVSMRPGELFDLVVADPPWVPHDGIGAHPEDPTLAIDGGGDGLDVARAVLAVSRAALHPGGSLLVQLGTREQADRLVAEAGAGWTEAGLRTGERGVVLRLRRD